VFHEVNHAEQYEHQARSPVTDLSTADRAPDDAREPPILVLGVPRSGTTWVGKVLALGYDARFVNEPDSEHKDPFAFKAKLDLGRFPLLSADERAPSAYVELWRRAFRGARPSSGLRTVLARWLIQQGRNSGDLATVQCWRGAPSPMMRTAAALAVPPGYTRDGRRLVIKSVHAPLAAEWVGARQPTARVVVVTRHPLNVIASWVDLGYRDCHLDLNTAVLDRFGKSWDLRPPPATASDVSRVAWEIALFMSALQGTLARYPTWIEASHEDLCLDAKAGFERLFAQLGLAWSNRVEDFLRRSNQSSEDPSSTERVGRDQPTRWRRTLSSEQVATIGRVLDGFPLLRSLAARVPGIGE
jgi:hypothetical protein